MPTPWLAGSCGDAIAGESDEVSRPRLTRRNRVRGSATAGKPNRLLWPSLCEGLQRGVLVHPFNDVAVMAGQGTTMLDYLTKCRTWMSFSRSRQRRRAVIGRVCRGSRARREPQNLCL